MKGAITAMITIMILVFSVFIMQSVSAGSVRQDELTTNTSNALEQSLRGVKKGEITNNEQLAQAFQANLKARISSDSKVHVDVLNANYTNGSLSVKVTETYQLPNGKKKTIVCEKTGMLEKANYK